MKKTLLILSMSCYIGMAQFTEQNPLEAGTTGNESFVIDMDNDGVNDVVYHNDNGIQWRGSADGENTFHNIHQAYLIPPENFEYIISIAPEDIDGDGDVDIAFATQGDDGPGVAWLENLGAGEFAEHTVIFDSPSMRRIYFEDADADGDPDLIANTLGDGGEFENQIVIIENLGGGSFETPVSIEVYPSERISNMGDIDGDGDLDMIVGVNVDDHIRLYENLGGMTFGPATVIAISLDNLKELHATDIDEDGDLDVAYSASAGEKIGWIENIGGGTFGDEHLIYTGENPGHFRFEDFDGDADLDIVFSWSSSPTYRKISLLEKTGPGTFAPAVELVGPIYLMSSISTGDLNMDGMMDILYEGKEHAQYSYISNEGGLSFSDPIVLIAHNFYIEQMVNDDFNGDGLIDLLCLSRYPGNINWFENLGDGTFGPSNTIVNEMYGLNASITLDIDGDADLDLIVSSLEDSTISLIENLGGGTFGPMEVFEVGPITTRKMLALDLNDDGNMDFIRMGVNYDNIITYHENLGGSFAPAVEIPTPAITGIDIELTDLDLDGDEDLIFLGWDDGYRYAWFENTGGAFASEVILFSSNSSDFTIADLNNDGNADIVAINGIFSPEIFWFENLGGAVFAEKELILTGHLAAYEILTSDLNGNGNLDIIVGGIYAPGDGALDDPTTGQLTWIENLGDATFAPPIDISIDILGFNNMSLGDVNGDGDDDIFTAALLDSEIAWFKNTFLTSQQVQGNFYYDENENGIREVDEIGLGGIQVESDPLGDFAYTHINGNYILNFDDASDGDYLISPQALEHWTITSDPEVYTVTVDDFFDGVSGLDFGFYPADEDTEVTGSVIGGFPRCGSTISYYVSFENIGGAIANGVVELALDEDITYLDAPTTPDSVVDNTVYWSYEDLFFFDEQSIQLFVDMPLADLEGETLTSYLTVTSLDELGAELFVFEDSISQVLVCAYDPNDKTVSPKGDGDFGNIPPTTPYLEYTVRFQNTGSDTAINIVIKDQLDENLDWSSLEILGSSDPMATYIDHLGEASFTFNDIMLPDSNVNELASHGFLKYRIDLLPDLPIGTVITNTANIYFDANPAVITNTSVNTLFESEIDDSGILENELTTVLVYPNPFSATTTIYFGKALGKNLTITVYNVLGNKIYQQSNISGKSYELSSAVLGKGIYILTVESANLNQPLQTTRLIVQ